MLSASSTTWIIAGSVPAGFASYFSGVNPEVSAAEAADSRGGNLGLAINGEWIQETSDLWPGFILKGERAPDLFERFFTRPQFAFKLQIFNNPEHLLKNRTWRVSIAIKSSPFRSGGANSCCPYSFVFCRQNAWRSRLLWMLRQLTR